MACVTYGVLIFCEDFMLFSKKLLIYYVSSNKLKDGFMNIVSRLYKVITTTYNQEEGDAPLDKQAVAVLLLATLSLLFIQFIAKTWGFVRLVNDLGLHSSVNTLKQFFAMSSEHGNLVRLLWFASFSFFFYVLFPMLFIKTFFKKSFADFGLKLKGAFQYWQYYTIFMLIMFPLVLFVARVPSFQNMYPFYRQLDGNFIWQNLLIWECFYFLQFVGTEFFFRGFLVHGLKHKFGFYALFISMMPYCMIHFQKPFFEAFGSIIAGFILGVMSLRTNSVIMGVLLHFGVALTMDVCAILMRS